MAMTPEFAATPVSGTATLATANTALDGTGTMVTIIAGGVNGTRIDNIMTRATATTAAGLINFFLSSTTGANTAANTHLIHSITIPAVTPSATTAAASSLLSSVINVDILPIFVPAGFTLRAAPTQNNAFRVTASGGDF